MTAVLRVNLQAEIAAGLGICGKGRNGHPQPS
jgi:hypothetical protein